ncbi:heart- and neural crest derivatives-expressed protein 1-like [Dendronephthya gigantea]|uniref:heart- and neural crest derivatives-expressed protein 1-like n=1 Tax=Dendronephthya gigantea TaxID=151771 RepID=UPI001069F2E5|nr:heart- and neural crest derivatives-expressed protein 1-like [Dendronephthya gigantea]
MRQSSRNKHGQCRRHAGFRGNVNIYEVPHQQTREMEKDQSQCPEFGFRLNHHEQNTKMKSKQNFNEVNGFPKKTERRRTETMNLAFATLREHIPNVPTDTKLSKIKTLRLAISYIRYLREVLDGEDPGEYVVDLKRDRNIAMGIADQYDYEEKQKKEVEYKLLPKRKRGRTGWPQKVWALELKNE